MLSIRALVNSVFENIRFGDRFHRLRADKKYAFTNINEYVRSKDAQYKTKEPLKLRL